mgnify:CR=1 FL=1
MFSVGFVEGMVCARLLCVPYCLVEVACCVYMEDYVSVDKQEKLSSEGTHENDDRLN